MGLHCDAIYFSAVSTLACISLCLQLACCEAALWNWAEEHGPYMYIVSGVLLDEELSLDCDQYVTQIGEYVGNQSQ